MIVYRVYCAYTGVYALDIKKLHALLFPPVCSYGFINLTVSGKAQ